MAKERNSKYVLGKRSSNWLKIKVKQTTECYIIGYTEGRSDRAPYFGALHLGTFDQGKWTYRGKVGTGFDEEMMKEISEEIKVLAAIERPVEERPIDEAKSTWVNPEIICEIEYASLTDKDAYREPIFIRLRPDLQINIV